MQNFDGFSSNPGQAQKVNSFNEGPQGNPNTLQIQEESARMKNLQLSPIAEEQNSVLSGLEPYQKEQEIMVKVPELKQDDPEKNEKLNFTNNMNTNFKIKHSVLNMSI